jgi:hypothetical protein
LLQQFVLIWEPVGAVLCHVSARLVLP